MKVRTIGDAWSAPGGTIYHKKILRTEKIPGTKTGNNLWLACGHRAQSFGDLGLLDGVVLCQDCLAGREEGA